MKPIHAVVLVAVALSSFSVMAQDREPGMDAGTPARSSDAGVGAATAEGEKPALDVSKMPFGPPAIKQVMMHHVDEVQACYSESLANKYGKRAKLMEGRLLTSFVINKKGHVKSAEVVKEKSSVNDPAFNRCVVKVLRAMTFPVPKDGRDHPIRFPYKLKVTG